MPEISRFHGIVIKMFNNDHNPPHFHAEFSGKKAVFDFKGNVTEGDLGSSDKTKLVRKWVGSHVKDLEKCWDLAVVQKKSPGKIRPLS